MEAASSSLAAAEAERLVREYARLLGPVLPRARVAYRQDVAYPEIIEVLIRLPSPSWEDVETALSVADFPAASAADAFLSVDVRGAGSCSEGIPGFVPITACGATCLAGRKHRPIPAWRLDLLEHQPLVELPQALRTSESQGD
jgi:hypothetical protein